MSDGPWDAVPEVERHEIDKQVRAEFNLSDDVGVTPQLRAKLTTLSAWGNPKITDASVKLLTKLTTLTAGRNPNITDASVKLLTKLTWLDAEYNPKITDASVKRLTKLTTLVAEGNPKITAASMETVRARANALATPAPSGSPAFCGNSPDPQPAEVDHG